jgi:hypothetical protein
MTRLNRSRIKYTRVRHFLHFLCKSGFSFLDAACGCNLREKETAETRAKTAYDRAAEIAQESAKPDGQFAKLPRRKVIDRKFGVRGHVRALKAATCRRNPERC